ncbi:MAG: cell division protein [Firmicutes bacterium]|nr:cell division protein [Bacillota bacterium]
MTNQTVFALDIGTRKIAGLLIEKTPEGFNIIDTEIIEQLPNAMKDGQIHDIPLVAATITKVKERLAERIGQPLDKAAVAAAGRTLITKQGQATEKLDPSKNIDQMLVQSLEIAATQNALSQMNSMHGQTSIDSYLCVGKTITHCFLDDQPIQNLVGHKGYSATIQLIATFLPRIVVDSLISSLEMAGLEMESLTLEPIAAIHTVVPQPMRMLNLALVDIGAGTADIAISANGTVKAYGMVPMAGDAITHQISNQFLLDFIQAEQVKRQLNSNNIIECQDVLGNQLQLNRNEILDVIQPIVSQLAEKICDEILVLNEDTPKGVMLIGGGSLTPNICQAIASRLNLPDNLVRIRERASLKEILGAEEYAGPQIITSMSIGCNHLDGLAMDMQKTMINGQVIQFFRMPGATIGDALLHAGYSSRDLLGPPGKALTIYVNGQRHMIKGTLGKPAKIMLNNKEATIDSVLQGNDQITISAPRAGEDGQCTLAELINDLSPKLRLTINGEVKEFVADVTVNNEKRSLDYQLQEGDRVEIQTISLREVLGYIDYEDTITVTVNHQPITLKRNPQIYVNNKPVNLDYQLKDKDRISFNTATESHFILSDIFTVYDMPDLKTHGMVTISVNGSPVGYTHQIQDGDVITITKRN